MKIGEIIELIPNGSNIPVTLENREEFINLTHEKIISLIVNGVTKQANAFLEGLKKIIHPKFLKKFTAVELRKLTEGSNKV